MELASATIRATTGFCKPCGAVESLDQRYSNGGGWPCCYGCGHWVPPTDWRRWERIVTNADGSTTWTHYDEAGVPVKTETYPNRQRVI